MRWVLIAAIILCVSAITASAAGVKDADLDGTWYPASKNELTALLNGYLVAAEPEERISGDLFAVIVPHAGYRFSGPVAAYAFNELARHPVRTIIILGFSHHRFFDGIAIYDAGIFRTPIGDIAVDSDCARQIAAQSRRISFNPRAFFGENSVEMQIPFIQLAVPDARIVPIVFGTQNYEDARIVADALAAVLRERNDCVVLASTDLSHYHTDDEARTIDARTIRLISEMKARELYDDARLGVCELCGLMPVTATLLAAERLGYASVRVLKYANSGDTAGPKDGVVGYLSAAVYREREKKMLNDDQRTRLLRIARQSITGVVRDGKEPRFTETDARFTETMGVFVTLHKHGSLRGCIGNLIGRKPLYQTVADMAVEAAVDDPRFPRLAPEEIDQVDIEISVLSPLKKVATYETIRIPGDGVLVRRGPASGVYLPQVAHETGWTREEFLTSLCRDKAGLPPDAWKDPATELYIFTAEVFGEKKEGSDEE